MEYKPLQSLIQGTNSEFMPAASRGNTGLRPPDTSTGTKEDDSAAAANAAAPRVYGSLSRWPWPAAPGGAAALSSPERRRQSRSSFGECPVATRLLPRARVSVYLGCCAGLWQIVPRYRSTRVSSLKSAIPKQSI